MTSSSQTFTHLTVSLKEPYMGPFELISGLTHPYHELEVEYLDRQDTRHMFIESSCHYDVSVETNEPADWSSEVARLVSHMFTASKKAYMALETSALWSQPYDVARVWAEDEPQIAKLVNGSTMSGRNLCKAIKALVPHVDHSLSSLQRLRDDNSRWSATIDFLSRPVPTEPPSHTDKVKVMAAVFTALGDQDPEGRAELEAPYFIMRVFPHSRHPRRAFFQLYPDPQAQLPADIWTEATVEDEGDDSGVDDC